MSGVLKILESALDRMDRARSILQGPGANWGMLDTRLDREELASLPLPYERSPMLAPIPMLLWCPACGLRHVDTGEFATKEHHTHACQSCGMVWRPCVLLTVGVQFLPGFKNG